MSTFCFNLHLRVVIDNSSVYVSVLSVNDLLSPEYSVGACFVNVFPCIIHFGVINTPTSLFSYVVQCLLG